jgi:hypothetical protein
MRIKAFVREQPIRARRERRLERRRLQHQDSVSARLAELRAMETLLERAAEIVECGWVQDAWFTVATRRGQRHVAAYEIRMAETRPVLGACLVGAVVQAGGGPSAVNTQVVRRTLDLTWHTLYGRPDERVSWCPGPSVRMLHVLDLTRWNDEPRRKQREVVGLLTAAKRLAELERSRYLADLTERRRASSQDAPLVPDLTPAG